METVTNHYRPMGARPEDLDLKMHVVEGTSPFRAAFTQARLEGRIAGDVMVAAHASKRKRERKTVKTRPATPAPAADGFEVRIEKRRGKRAMDASRWNELGHDGWELVAVVGKQAFFRRDRRHAGDSSALAAATSAR